MSWFSRWITLAYGNETPESASDILKRLVGSALPRLREFAEQVIEAAAGTDFDNATKRSIAAAIIKAFARRVLHVTLPDSIVNWLVEEVLVLLKARLARQNSDEDKDDEPDVTSDPVPLYGRWLDVDPGDENLKNGDHVYSTSPGRYYVTEGVPILVGFFGAPSSNDLMRIGSKP